MRPRSRSLGVFAATVLVLTITSGCARRGALTPLVPVTSLVAVGGGAPVIRAAIIEGLRDRRYEVEGESDHGIIASYRRGRHFIRIAVRYDDRAFVIEHLQSSGLQHQTTASGSEVVGRHYARYVSDLESSIQSRLRRSATRSGVVVVAAGGTVTGALYAPSCEDVVRSRGDSFAVAQCFADTDVVCADTLLSLGLPTIELRFCRNVEPTCARAHLLSGGSAVGLGRCRY